MSHIRDAGHIQLIQYEIQNFDNDVLVKCILTISSESISNRYCKLVYLSIALISIIPVFHIESIVYVQRPVYETYRRKNNKVVLI